MSDKLTVEVTAHDLPLHCPTPNSPLWSQHPRVFLDVLKTGEVTCPYCSAQGASLSVARSADPGSSNQPDRILMTRSSSPE
jgi:uncharacterized Zn-finger protein